MAVTLVTGGTGLVGSHVVRALVERGDHVRLAVRDGALLDNLAGLEVELVTADVLDRRAVRRAMHGVTRLFHVAGMTSLRAGADAMFRVNVEGTRIVLEEALRAGVERVVHTSSVAAIGPAPRGSTADEAQVFRAGRYGLPYVSSKHEAETVALRVAAHGLDVVIVNPGHVFGRGDLHRSSTEIVRRFLRREIPAYVDGALNVVDAEDAARGHLLAEERGRTGERYILGNRNFTLDRLFADLGRLSGVEPPAVKLPLPVALAAARLVEALPGRPAFTENEVRAASLWWAFRSTKA
ncbi:MAG TPA: NAD-dependent epimerase/dehydratase family protein, partial [Solirubrobacteraceae bacterium]|nr:NAD-dependent epimerase/dehydratase family protein [Solirubrobacteraceae bacterium]